jgi:hypothetical protein
MEMAAFPDMSLNVGNASPEFGGTIYCLTCLAGRKP